MDFVILLVSVYAEHGTSRGIIILNKTEKAVVRIFLIPLSTNSPTKKIHKEDYSGQEWPKKAQTRGLTNEVKPNL